MLFFLVPCSKMLSRSSAIIVVVKVASNKGVFVAELFVVLFLVAMKFYLSVF